MPSYTVQFVEGASVRAGEASGFMGFRRTLSIEALDRVDAYVAVYRKLSARGEVTVLGYRGGDEKPLGFSEQEQEAVRRAGLTLVVGYPRTTGSHIEMIAAESPPARMGLRLPRLPDLMFSSWEDEVAGQWSTFYEIDSEPVSLTFAVSESDGAGLVDQARTSFSKSGGSGKFDIERARRDAADRLVVSQVLDALRRSRQ